MSSARTKTWGCKLKIEDPNADPENRNAKNVKIISEKSIVDEKDVERKYIDTESSDSDF